MDLGSFWQLLEINNASLLMSCFSLRKLVTMSAKYHLHSDVSEKELS